MTRLLHGLTILREARGDDGGVKSYNVTRLASVDVILGMNHALNDDCKPLASLELADEEELDDMEPEPEEAE